MKHRLTIPRYIKTLPSNMIIEHNAKKQLEYIRRQIRAERVSMGQIVELQTLSKYIDPGDVELLQWAGVPESINNQEVTA